MSITITKTVDININDCIRNAREFVSKKYPQVDFSDTATLATILDEMAKRAHEIAQMEAEVNYPKRSPRT